MSPQAYQKRMVTAANEQTEAFARIEAEQARQATVQASILQRLDELSADRPKRSPTKS